MEKKSENMTIRGVRGATELGTQRLGSFYDSLKLFSNPQNTKNKPKSSTKKEAA